jgi:apolipoprotein N-acyltransferase
MPIKRIFIKIFFVKIVQLYLLALLSGLLLTFAWFPHGFLPLLFIGFVPLLLVERMIAARSGKYNSLLVFTCAYVTFITWNVLTTWWVKNASFGGAMMAFLCNSLLMALVFLLYYQIKKRIGEKYQYLIFCCFWISWEFLHLDWDLSWPWLTLGNAFADQLNWVQWYEYTGVFGGGLWVLIVNCIIASCFIRTEEKSKFYITQKKMVAVALIMAVPILLSFFVEKQFSANRAASKEKMVDVVVVQPNIDPYNEKFFGEPVEHLRRMLVQAEQHIDSTTEYALFPETAITGGIWEEDIDKAESIVLMNGFLKKYPNLKIIIGASTAKSYNPGETLSSTARKFGRSEGYYDDYNTALQLDKTGKVQVYHKSKLVPGAELLPFRFIFKHIDNLAIDLGGTTGSLGMQPERSVLVSPDQQLKAAPVICYESIYGEYVGEYIKNGATFIAIITNDGWWGDTPGYKQHLKYGALRAIETRRWIARSANTGISCFITPEGEILQPTSWWVPAAIKAGIGMDSSFTFYTRFGDYIARIALFGSILLLIYSLLIRFRIVKK